MTKSGTGKFLLSGANTYSGNTNITAGTLQITGTLADTTDVVVSSGAYTMLMKMILFDPLQVLEILILQALKHFKLEIATIKPYPVLLVVLDHWLN